MAESSVSKSVSAISQNKEYISNLAHGRGSFIDRIFPLIDEISQFTKMPEWIMNIVMIYFSLQILSVGLWIYTPIFDRVSEKYQSIYNGIISAFTIDTPHTYTKFNNAFLILCVVVAAVIICWIYAMIVYNKRHYTISEPFIYISSILIDIISPIFIIPSAFVLNHGITGLKFSYSINYIAEIIGGSLSCIALSVIFLLSIILRSRSVVLSNSLFPAFNTMGIAIYIVVNTLFSVISAIFTFFEPWYFVLLNIIHILIMVYVCYMTWYIPFYHIWRNSLMMSLSITSIVLDINFLVLYFVKSLSYNFTIIVFIVSLVLFDFIFYFIYKKRFNVIKKELSAKNITTGDVQECLSQLKLNSTSKLSMYVLVGLSQACDLLCDDSLIDYIMNSSEMEELISLLLQVVTFFPSESRKMDVCYKKVVLKRKISIVERFLVYQVYRIKMRRLVSDSKDTLEMISKLKAMNEGCKSSIRSFWDKNICKNSFLSSMASKVDDVNSYFKAALQNNPNNVRIRNEYANFLVECKCDFDSAAIETIRSDTIGDGKNFFVDTSFRSMVNKFPSYLKQNILDTKGKKIIKRNDGTTKSSSSSNRSNHSSVDSFSMDVERQEVACKKLIRDSKLRLAFNHSIKDGLPIESKVTGVLSFINFIVILFFFVGFSIYLHKELSWMRMSYEDLSLAGYSVFYNIYSNVYTLSKFAQDTNRYIDNEEILGDTSIDKTTVTTLVPSELSLEMKNFICITHSKEYLRDLLNSLASQALEFDIYQMAKELISTQSLMTVCDNASAKYVINASLKGQLLVLAFMQNTIMGQYSRGQYFENIFLSNDYCQVVSNFQFISDQSDSVFKAILNYNLNKSEKYNNRIEVWMILGAVIMFLIVSIPMFITGYKFVRKIDNLLVVLLSLSNQVKDDAKAPLVINSDSSSESISGSATNDSNVFVSLYLVFYFFMFATIILYILLCYNTLDLNKDLEKCLVWFYNSCTRIVIASEIGNNVIQLVLLNESLPQSYINVTELNYETHKDLDELLQVQHDLQYGNEKFGGSLGFDETLDDLHLRNHCDLGHDPSTIHDMYACSGLNQEIRILKNLVQEVLNQPESFKGMINDEISVNIMHELRFHFYPNVIKSTKRISEILENRYDSGMLMSKIYLVAGLVLLFILTIIPWIIVKLIIRNYRVVLSLLQHLSPNVILATPEILDFFRNSKRNQIEKMSTAKSIVHDTSECIVIANQNAVIEIVNHSFTENIGLTPDQLLGQNIANFVATKDQERLRTQIDLMVNGQGSLFWEDHIELVDDKDDNVPFAITMIGMKENDNSYVSSFVFILSNETEEIQKRKAAEEAKAKSEKLLYQILPKDIVVRLNRGETDISFTIPSATIFFIDIVKFSNYTATLTPSEIMKNLSLVFATFDKNVAEFPSITKIKLIGDVYMAASGLFQEEGKEINHAEDAVRCCLNCQKSMDEINAKLDSSLEIRIGINSGGPLIGGVLGSDKPTFDIIGDTINVAARLQSTDIPGNVQISEETKKMIENLEFNIEERGEIFLKGKGNRLTYFVSYCNKEETGNTLNLLMSGRE